MLENDEGEDPDWNISGRQWIDHITSKVMEPVETTHGSISKQEANIIFFMFYPDASSSNSPVTQQKIIDFLSDQSGHFHKKTAGTTDFHYSTGMNQLFVDSVKYSHELFMEP